MKIILIGASGGIGKAAYDELASRHEIVTVGRSSGDVQTDLSNRKSVASMYKKTGRVDAVVSTAGNVHFGPLAEFTEEQFMLGLTDNVMGQINVALEGVGNVNDFGSFTLTTGVLNRDPIRMCAGAATANGAIAGFVV